MSKIDVPVLLIIFNRFDETKKLIESLRLVKPKKIFVASDGPRTNNIEEYQIVMKVRELINKIDWDCNIFQKFNKENLGCKTNVIQAIDWLFKNEEYGIILEDDCIPNRSFFDFCITNLDKYKNDEKIMHINGSFYLHEFVNIPETYYFSKLVSCWGWATWKRSWSRLERDISKYKEVSKTGKILKYYNNNLKMSKWMESYFEDALYAGSKVWSSFWAYTIMINNGLCITPTKHLVKNIGMNDLATSNINDSFKLYGNFETNEIKSFVHKEHINYNARYDDLEFKTIISNTDPRLIDNNIVKLYKFLKSKLRYAIKGYDK